MKDDLVFKALADIASEKKMLVTPLLLKFDMLRETLTRLQPGKSSEFYNKETVEAIREMYK